MSALAETIREWAGAILERFDDALTTDEGDTVTPFEQFTPATRRQETLARRAMRALASADILDVTVTDTTQLSDGSCEILIRDEAGHSHGGTVYHLVTLTITDDD